MSTCALSFRWIPPLAAAFLLSLTLVGGCAAPVAPIDPALQAARTDVAEGRLEEAHARYRALLEARPEHPDARVEYADLRDRLLSGVIEEARRAEAEAPGPEGWRAARARLDAARVFDDEGNGLAPERARVDAVLARHEREITEWVERIHGSLDRSEFDVARDQLEGLRALDPDAVGLSELEARLEQGRVADLEASMREALRRGDLVRARAAWAELEGIDSAFAASLSSEFEREEDRQIGWRSRKDRQAGRYLTAVRRIGDGPGAVRHAALLEALRDEGAEHYLRQARARMERGETSRAYLEASKGRELAPEHAGLAAIHATAQRVEARDLQIALAIPPFETPEGEREVGSDLADALAGALEAALPFGIWLVDRAAVDQAYDPEDPRLGERLGADRVVAALVTEVRIARGAHDDQLHLAADLSLRIHDTATASLVLDQGVRVERSLDRQEQAAALAPGALPSEAQALSWLRADIGEQMAALVQARFVGRHATLLEDARNRWAQGEAEWAMVPLAQAHLVCVESELGEKDPHYEAVLGEILARTERDFLTPSVASPPPWE